MLNFVIKREFCEAVGICVSVVALSEIMMRIHLYVAKKIKGEPVSRAYMFNEMGYDCHLEHRKHTMEGTLFECKNEHCSQRLVGHIITELDRAKYSIDLAMYSFTSLEIMRALVNAVKRSVKVRIILNHRIGCNLTQPLSKLIAMSIPVRYPKSSNLMHHKFCVIDGRSRVDELWLLRGRKCDPLPTRPVLINGSVNWTTGGFNANYEFMVISSEPHMVSEYQEEFSRLWNALPEQYSRNYPTLS